MSKGAVVCVDDERFVLISLRDRLIAFLGGEYEIVLAESGEEALEICAQLKQEQIDIPLVICDRLMPGMSGTELLTRIEGQFPETRKILLTGYANIDDIIEAIEQANLYRYIAKPWNAKDLELTVKEAIRSYFQERRAIEQTQALQREIAERQQAQKLLQESEERLENILNSLEEIVWSAEPNSLKFLYLNAAAEKIFGRPVSKFLQNNNLWLKSVHPQDRKKVARGQETLLLTGSLDLEYRIVRPDGELRWLSSRSSVIYDASGAAVRLDGIIRDITTEKVAKEQLVRKTSYDSLTGLANRSVLVERLKKILPKFAREQDYLCAVLFIDLDRFKVLNDSLGHQMGDRAIVETARRLEKIVRTTDAIARIGGDEFVILLEPIDDVNDAIRIAERIAERLKLPLILDGQKVFTSASIGIALSSPHYDRADELLRDADIAMYRAKAKGRCCYEVFDSEMYAQALAQHQWENDLRQALERQEFQVYYQPIVSAKNGTIAGFEALIRWLHPERGFVSPAQFIPIAEENGSIVPIGQWVLESVCQQIKLWQAQFGSRTPKVSVNLSAKQLRDAHFLKKIDCLLEQTAIEGSYLQLELTESMLMDGVEYLLELLSQLRKRGIQLSIDDFGTGYSSLSYLHRFPVNYLKIDRSFVRDLDSKHESLKITESIVALARNLNIAAIAEGVETKAQLSLLGQLNCEYIQGYLFSPPVPASAATDLLKKHSVYARSAD
jgi:diguanylate cyclase (GGDEF)-like protein/PAS domain S-box-containing protein